MGTFVWLYSPRTNSPHLTMNSFVVFATLLAAAACAAPQSVRTVVQGPQTGPLTPIVGDAVATPKGFRSLALEGFSEDLNEDGFVDPIVPAAPAPVVPAPAPIVRTVAAPAPFFAPAPIAHTVAAPAPVNFARTVAAPAFAHQVAAPAFAHQVAPVFNAPAPIAAPVAAPVLRTVVNQAPVAFAPQFAAPATSAFFQPARVAAPVFNAPATTVEHIAPTPVVTKTISPIPVPFRHAPVAHVFDSRLHG